MLMVNDAFRETADKLTGQSHRAEQLEREDALQRASECCRGYASYLGGRPWREHQTMPMSAHMASVRHTVCDRICIVYPKTTVCRSVCDCSQPWWITVSSVHTDQLPKSEAQSQETKTTEAGQQEISIQVNHQEKLTFECDAALGQRVTFSALCDKDIKSI
jgi:hypothetical protein